jgi:protein SCO1/2
MFKKIIKNPYFCAFLIGIASLHIIKECALLRQSAPEPLVILPDWTLINQKGELFGKANLLKKPFIACYFFTTCPTICPKIIGAMKEVHARFHKEQEELNFVSITVDPKNDSPEVLQNYMNKNGLDFKNWYSLTGKDFEIYDVVVNKMKVHMGEKELGKNGYDIPHMAHLALFDKDGNLRGLFKTDSIELSALVRAAKFLLKDN